MSVQSADIINAFKKSQFTFFNIKEAQIEHLPVSGRVRCNISVLSFALNFCTDSLFKIYHNLFYDAVASLASTPMNQLVGRSVPH